MGYEETIPSQKVLLSVMWHRFRILLKSAVPSWDEVEMPNHVNSKVPVACLICNPF